MAVAIDEMSVEVAPLAATTQTHGAGPGGSAGAAPNQTNSASLHKAMVVLHERKMRLKTT